MKFDVFPLELSTIKNNLIKLGYSIFTLDDGMRISWENPNVA